MSSFHTKLTDEFMDVISKLNDREECYKFFEDVATIKEIQDMSKRLEAAKLLYSGKSYNEISETLGLSTATLSRVSKALNYGAGGYKKIIDEISK